MYYCKFCWDRYKQLSWNFLEFQSITKDMFCNSFVGLSIMQHLTWLRKLNLRKLKVCPKSFCLVSLDWEWSSTSPFHALSIMWCIVFSAALSEASFISVLINFRGCQNKNFEEVNFILLFWNDICKLGRRYVQDMIFYWSCGKGSSGHSFPFPKVNSIRNFKRKEMYMGCKFSA